jgi:hypothetical protein
MLDCSSARRTVQSVVKALERSRKPPRQPRAKNPLPNRAKLVGVPASKRKREYRVDRRQQNRAKRRHSGTVGLLGSALVFAASGISARLGRSLRVGAARKRISQRVSILDGLPSGRTYRTNELANLNIWN